MSASSNSRNRLRGGKSFRRLATSLLTIVGFAFLFYLAWNYRQDIVSWTARVDYLLAAVSIVSLLLSTVGAALIFQSAVAFNTKQAKVGGDDTVGIFLLSQLGKYVPGRIWGIAFQHLAGRGRSLRVVVVANVELAALASLTTVGAALIFVVWLAIGWLLASITLALLLSFAYAIITMRAVPRVMALMGGFLTGPSSALSATDMQVESNRRVTPALGVLLFVLGYCVGWLALVAADSGANFDEALRLAAILSLAYVVGLVSMLPAGLGAREAALLALGMWVEVDLATVASLAVVSRLAMVVVDLAAVMLAGIILAKLGR